MSIWTHVNAAIRIDGMPGVVFTRPDYRLPPVGSEGALVVCEHEYGTGLPWLAVNVFGDLRDFGRMPGDIESVVAYVQQITGPGILVRDGVATIQVESEPAQVWLWRRLENMERDYHGPFGEWIRVDGAKP